MAPTQAATAKPTRPKLSVLIPQSMDVAPILKEVFEINYGLSPNLQTGVVNTGKWARSPPASEEDPKMERFLDQSYLQFSGDGGPNDWIHWYYQHPGGRPKKRWQRCDCDEEHFKPPIWIDVREHKVQRVDTADYYPRYSGSSFDLSVNARQSPMDVDDHTDDGEDSVAVSAEGHVANNVVGPVATCFQEESSGVLGCGVHIFRDALILTAGFVLGHICNLVLE